MCSDVRVVKEIDSKSIGLCPRRFESCSLRIVLQAHFYLFGVFWEDFMASRTYLFVDCRRDWCLGRAVDGVFWNPRTLHRVAHDTAGGEGRHAKLQATQVLRLREDHLHGRRIGLQKSFIDVNGRSIPKSLFCRFSSRRYSRH